MRAWPRILGIALISAAGGMIVAGCETSDATLRDSGKSEGYITGFHDGRQSGMKEAGNYLERVVKDTGRFQSDADYRAGWLDGEVEGRRIQEQANASVGATAGAGIAREAEKDAQSKIDKAGRDATKGVDTEALKSLEKN